MRIKYIEELLSPGCSIIKERSKESCKPHVDKEIYYKGRKYFLWGTFEKEYSNQKRIKLICFTILKSFLSLGLILLSKQIWEDGRAAFYGKRKMIIYTSFLPVIPIPISTPKINDEKIDSTSSSLEREEEKVAEVEPRDSVVEEEKLTEEELSSLLERGLQSKKNGDKGIDLEQNYAEAFRYFERGARMGHPKGQYHLALLYLDGKGVDKSLSKYFDYTKLAADQEYAPAEYELGVIYREGCGAPQEYAKALQYFQLAADRGHLTARVDLGTMYLKGRGVQASHEEALRHYQLAADQDDPMGQCNLAIMYEEGLGVEQSYEKAIFYYMKACEKGNRQAAYCLGDLYENGIGVAQSDEKALENYRRAANLGYEKALEKVCEIETRLSYLRA